MKITRLQIARWLGWAGFAAYLGIILLEKQVRQTNYAWVIFTAIPMVLVLQYFGIKRWGGDEALNRSSQGFMEALISFGASGLSLLFLLFTGVLVFLFGLSIWSLMRG